MNILFNLVRNVALALCIGFIAVVIDRGQTFAASDDFNDNAKDATKWGADVIVGNGLLTEKNQRLEYSCVTPGLPYDADDRPWVLHRFPFNADWEIQIDTFNSTSPMLPVQVSSYGIILVSPLDPDSTISVEMYVSSLGGLPSRSGFNTELDDKGADEGIADSGPLGVTHGAVRMVFTAATKVITVFYDTDVSNGYQWVQYGSFGVAGSGGVDGNTDWGLSATDQFTAFVYGFSQAMIITSGQMYGDNFMEIGGVTSGGGPPPPPAPTGSFHFGFPTNNPLLTAIAFIAGNYHGVTPTSSQRNYSIDVAQDDSGKLMAMGTMDGIAGANGSPQIATSVGAVSTVNGDPTAQLSGSFNGTRDGVATSFTGMAQAPVEVVDIGGGTDGVNATGSYSSSIGGVPFLGSNLPLQVAAPPGAVDNLHKDWSIQLDITGQGKKKIKLKVGATLVLPNGETIVFAKKAAKTTSATSLATLTFSKGKNTMTRKKDKMTTVTISGLTFAFQNGAWQPTGGTINYNFLGQHGTANLTDFIFGP